MAFSRREAHIEGTKVIIADLKEKVSSLEDKNKLLERERQSLQDILSLRKKEYSDETDNYKSKLEKAEEKVKQLQTENDKLTSKSKMPDSGRKGGNEKEIEKLTTQLEESEQRYSEALEDNETLRNEVRDLHLEMEEMH